MDCLNSHKRVDEAHPLQAEKRCWVRPQSQNAHRLGMPYLHEMFSPYGGHRVGVRQVSCTLVEAMRTGEQEMRGWTFIGDSKSLKRCLRRSVEERGTDGTRGLKPITRGSPLETTSLAVKEKDLPLHIFTACVKHSGE